MTCSDCKNALPPRDGFPYKVLCRRFGLHVFKEADSSSCKYFEQLPKTNYDRLIRKTPEELAEWLVFVEQRILELQPMLERPALYADWLNWLKQESESGG